MLANRKPSAPELCDKEKDQSSSSWDKKELRYGSGPYVSNGVPIASGPILDCCASDPCFCRSDVIFYDGVAYDQKPLIAGRLRTRLGNVMFFEGKMVPPFNPGKSPLKYGPQFYPDKQPMSNCYNANPWGRGRHQCCSSSISWDRGLPIETSSARRLAYTDMGLPHGRTIGYFRFKPDRMCYARDHPILRFEDCCNCNEPERYNASFYIQDECPRKPCC